MSRVVSLGISTTDVDSGNRPPIFSRGVLKNGHLSLCKWVPGTSSIRTGVYEYPASTPAGPAAPVAAWERRQRHVAR